MHKRQWEPVQMVHEDKFEFRALNIINSLQKQQNFSMHKREDDQRQHVLDHEDKFEYRA